MGQPSSIPADPRPVRMPNANDPSILAAGKRAVAKRKGAGGRQSTILSDALNRLNGSQGALGA